MEIRFIYYLAYTLFSVTDTKNTYMQTINKNFFPETGNADKNQEEQKKAKTDKEKKDTTEEVVHEEKNSKFKDALQQWANDDARDIAEDDSTPMRSGL